MRKEKKDNKIKKQVIKSRTGKIIREAETKNGQLHGYYRSYYENSDIVCEDSSWIEGKIDGHYKIYDKDGTLKEHRLYKRGILKKDFLKEEEKE